MNEGVTIFDSSSRAAVARGFDHKFRYDGSLPAERRLGDNSTTGLLVHNPAEPLWARLDWVMSRSNGGASVNESYVGKIAGELNVAPRQVAATAALLTEGATVPFIARYRKEATGTLDEVAVTEIRDRMAQLAELDGRRAAILQSLQERELLTDDLSAEVAAAETMTALAGALAIRAERFSDEAIARATLRQLYWSQGAVKSAVVPGKETEGAKFRDYFDWTEPVSSIPSHRMLAVRRGEAEGFLRVRIAPRDEGAIAVLERLFLQAPGTPGGEQVRLAAHDSYKRLLGSAIEGEIRFESKKKADTEAIRVFAANLRQLLLASPLGQKTVLAIDPGFRTGCKLVCLDAQGKLLHHDVVYPTAASPAQIKQAGDTVLALAHRFSVEAVAIGNGTAGRETEQFVRGLGIPSSILIAVVNESGASIYSASDVAREEFPDQDLTVRGAVSIGRRLMDPLSELVKLDPKSIGVGQYQHDVDQPSLKNGLDDVVVSCVNGVGVELNTASKQLLSYVSGLGPSLAGKIVAFRNEQGAYRSRNDLLRVPRLGPKAFEQCAG